MKERKKWHKTVPDRNLNYAGWAGLLEVSADLVRGPSLCPGAGVEERPQETL